MNSQKDLLQSNHRPVMIAIGGMSGSGKTTLAESLAEKFPDAVLLDSDVLMKRMHGVEPTTRLPDEIYTAENRDRFISYIHMQAAKQLLLGNSVIVTGAFLDHAARSKQEALAQRCGAQFVGLYLHAPLSTLYDRVAKRRNNPSDAGTHVVQRQFKGASKRPHRELPWSVIRAEKSPEYVTDRAMTIIRRHVKPPRRQTPQIKKSL